MKKVGIVILNYRNWQDTLECLQTVEDSTYTHREIVVVDNDSQNDSLTHIRHWFAARQLAEALLPESELERSAGLTEKRLLVQAASNRGYAAGNNLGLRVALARGADYLLLLNNDTLVEKGFLEPLVEYAETHERVGVVGPKAFNENGEIDTGCARRRPTVGDYFFRLGLGRLLFPDNRWVSRHYYRGEYAFDQPKEVDILSGACLLLKARVVRQLGLLDERTFLYLEEFILHEQLRAAGLSSVVVPASRIVHKGARSTAHVPSAFVRQAERDSLRYYLSRYRRFGPWTIALLMLASTRPAELLPNGLRAHLARSARWLRPQTRTP